MFSFDAAFSTQQIAAGMGNTTGLTTLVFPSFQRPKLPLGTGGAGSSGSGQIFPTGR